MVPKTNINIRQGGKWERLGIDNRFHIAGGGVHAGVRIKFTFWDRVYIQAALRGTYIKISNSLVDTENEPNARLSHTPISSIQFMGQIGYELPAQKLFNLFRKKKNKYKVYPGF